MPALDYFKAVSVLKQIQDDNPELVFTQEQFNKTINTYYRVANEQVNRNKTPEEQESMLSYIYISFQNNEQQERIYNHFSDNKHMDYFDTFLEEGLSEKILEVLDKYKLPSSVLKGIRKNQPYYGNSPENPDVYVEQITNKDIDPNTDESIKVVEFNIYYKKKLIFYWDIKNGADTGYDFEERDPVKIPKTKKGTAYKGYKKTIVTSDNNIIFETVTSKGQTVYRDIKGRFTRKI